VLRRSVDLSLQIILNFIMGKLGWAAWFDACSGAQAANGPIA
jgi:hypothetical protein